MTTEANRIERQHRERSACFIRADRSVTPKPSVESSSAPNVVSILRLVQVQRPAIGYREYMASAAWRAKRQVELKASGNRCRGCNLGSDVIQLEVHHRSYARFGNELPEDLTTLCVDCHPAITAVIRRRRYAGRAPVIGGVIDANCGVALFDPRVRGAWS
jgi:hypothetical protein